jgi:hypothetical protein
LFAVLGEEGDGDPGHDSILCVHGHATNFQRRSQVTFVTKAEARRQVSGGFEELVREVRQTVVEPDCKAKDGA